MAPFGKHASKNDEAHRRPSASSASSSSSSSSAFAQAPQLPVKHQQPHHQSQSPIPAAQSSSASTSAAFFDSRRSSNLSVSFNETVSYSHNSSSSSSRTTRAFGSSGGGIGVAEMEHRWSEARKAAISEGAGNNNNTPRVVDADTAGSSADETTGILGADRNGAGARTYNTNGTAAPNGGASGADGSAGGSLRSRRRAANGQDGQVSGDLDADEAENEEGWWKRLAEKYGSVELDNKGSVARDHLALERTFLAWLRTSLSFASIGIAVTQLFRLNTSIASGDHNGEQHERLRHVGKPLGATFIAISIIILFIGFHRYFESQHYVIRGKFPASRGSIVLVSAIAGALIVSSLVVILVVAPQAFERK